MEVHEFISCATAILAVILSITVYIHGLNRERKLDTLRRFSELRQEYFNTKDLDMKGKLKYLNELEHFATGVNEGIYDIRTVKRMSGRRLIKQYDTWGADLIKERRELSGTSTAFCEYEKLIKRIKK